MSSSRKLVLCKARKEAAKPELRIQGRMLECLLAKDPAGGMLKTLTRSGGAVCHQCRLFLIAGLNLQCLTVLVEEQICTSKESTCMHGL